MGCAVGTESATLSPLSTWPYRGRYRVIALASPFIGQRLKHPGTYQYCIDPGQFHPHTTPPAAAPWQCYRAQKKQTKTCHSVPPSICNYQSNKLSLMPALMLAGYHRVISEPCILVVSTREDFPGQGTVFTHLVCAVSRSLWFDFYLNWM